MRLGFGAPLVLLILSFPSGCVRVNKVLKYPENCSSDCRYFLEWEVISNNQIKFLLIGKTKETNPWVAIGFNEKSAMSGTEVIECIFYRGNLTVQASYNENHQNYLLNNPQLGIVEASSSGEKGNDRLECRFSHYIRTNSDDPQVRKVKQLDKSYYIIMARGRAIAAGKKSKHSERPFISSSQINFLDTSMTAFRSPLIVAHGSVMVFVWILLLSFAAVTSRYFKEDWFQGMVLLWKPVWFQLHRFLAFFSASIIVISILIVSSSRDWIFYPSTHSILGLTVTSMVALNLLSGMLRPTINSPVRKYFRYFHGFSGHALHIMGLVTLYFGLSHPMTYLPAWVSWVPLLFVPLRLAVDVVLTLLGRRDPNRNCYLELADNIDLEDETWSWRYAIAISYLIVCFGVSILVVVALNFSPVHFQ